ncbi:Eco29kI family restriction endonuclease [Nocardioides mangrovi]|uniref:Eco29kI family restriction endonuclease n=1 Tax=Nocardioides mangrovi TaxID=2874580 RepID=A0ABS7U998_9ACTN|nr:Eco29kI family restriction endonuclease [Nocardioides mangrovi]MBZ5737521.1 Eco29kI family restriction endonuclease [Nocardioides mangrovi]
MTDEPYNPLSMENLGHSVENALLDSTPTRMDQMSRFTGAGVYAIYYTGDAAPYETLGAVNQREAFEVPIYVGKAVPKGSRKGVEVATASGGTALSSRLKQHANSIVSAENLYIEDFYARWLVTQEIWIPLGESLMIGRFAPVWNSIVDGFGNHDPGVGRRAGTVSRWDVLHPGRAWAEHFKTRNETRADIEADVREYLRARIAI